MTTRQLPLRVLYTVNSSPQYILARSPSSVQVTLSSSPSAAHVQYGLVPLKLCLNAICNSSPELLLDNSRDFSIYVLDPLESQAMPVHVDLSQSNALLPSAPSAEQPRGVAVALGLMSWSLTADESDSVSVTGTITPLGTGLDALELIFALRETKHVQKSYLSDALKCWSQPQPIKSIPPPKSTDPEALPSLQEPVRHLTKSADFPEVYIGPPKRTRGRPEAANKKPKQSKTRVPPTRPGASPFICAPLVRSQYQCQQPQTAHTSSPTPLFTLLSALSGGRDNTALLAALSTVGSVPQGSEPGPVLLNTLRDILEAQSQNQQPAHALQPVSRNNQDDEIVILEKEHIDPTAFRRRVEREDSSRSTTTTADESEATTPQHLRRARIPSSGKENTYSSSLSRKRRLSDFMAEQENDNMRRKRTHSRSGSRRTSDAVEVPQLAVPLDYLRTARPDGDPSVPFSVPASSSLLRTKSSPCRPTFHSASDSFAKLPLGSRAPDRAVKHFVTPEWARTGTITQPRLSKEAEERLALLEQEKKQKRVVRRTQKSGARRHDVCGKTELSPEERDISGQSVHEPVRERSTPRLQSALSLSLPVFASDVSISSHHLPSSSLSEEPLVPSTPPRKTAVLRVTPRKIVSDGASPLFTPTPKSLWRSTAKTPLCSPHPCTPSRKGKNPIFSPLHLRTPATGISPLGLGLKPSSAFEWSSKPVEQSIDCEEEDLLGKELDEALQGLEVPEAKEQLADDVYNMTEPLSPLPPSSPPPPTSPLLLPSTDDAMEEFIDSEAFFSDSDVALGDGNELPSSLISDWSSSDDNGGESVGGLLTMDAPVSVDLEGAFASNVFADMEFTEFWESLKPLLEASLDEETAIATESGSSIGDRILTEGVQMFLSGA